MMRSHQTKLLLLVFACVVFSDCTDACKITSTYIYYKPVYSTSDEIKKAVAYEAPRNLGNLGRIYFKDGYLFINESGEGIHVINNSTPAFPLPIGFMKIPGNNDLAIVGNFLYANSYVDLVVFDIGDKNAIREVKRIEGVFDHIQSFGYALLANKMVLTGWRQEETVQVNESKCENFMHPWGGIYYEDGIAMASVSSGAAKLGVPPTNTGVSGSMATFTISKNRLYALDGSELDVINVTNPGAPVKGNAVEVSVDIETLFPFKDKLFAGSRSGMYIYDLVNPDKPKVLSKYEHVRSCDPVVVDDSYAYVTLRGGNSCQGFTNELEVISLENLAAPAILKTYPMTNPFGLGIDKNLLFICDGSAGLKIFDATDVKAIDNHLISRFPVANALDIIPFDNVAMMITSDGLYQYDYSDPKNIRAISKLPIVK
jgi:hypothetical protein